MKLWFPKRQAIHETCKNGMDNNSLVFRGIYFFKKNHNTAFKSFGHHIFHEENADLGNMFLQKGMPTTAPSETVKKKMV